MNDDDYAALARRLVATGILSDPWIDGQPRFDPRPLVLSADEARAYAVAAEAIAGAHEALCQLVLAEPDHLDRFFGLSPVQRLMWETSAPLWHGLARADVFPTDAGLAICELNSDTPSGEAEAVVLNAAASADHPDLVDPNTGLEARYCALLEHLAAELAGRRPPLSIGIVYPTEMPEDLSMIQLYRSWFAARGWSVVLGSPYNLQPAPGARVALFGQPLDVVVRHYKTDWWGERLPPWADAHPYEDPAPLSGPLGCLLQAAIEGTVAIVNPFGSVLPQNKRAMAFLWEEMARFSPAVQATVRAFLPETRRLERMERARLERERMLWVVKSDYGCEGDEVIVGAEVTDAEWREVLRAALPGRWVAQRRFEVRPDALGRSFNVGVYLVAGRTAGFFARASDGATDYSSQTVPTLVRGVWGPDDE